MAHPRFYSSQPLPRPPCADLAVDVTEEIARHFHVLRLEVDAPVTLFDGQGGEWRATITTLGKRRATLQLLQFDRVERESPMAITLVQALATSDKMDLIVQKAVELGVTFIQPIATERATLKLAGERAQKRTAHWQAVAQAACEQCGRNRVPQVADPLPFEDWLASPADGLRLLLQPDASASLLGTATAAGRLALLVGPEGGFSDRELDQARKSGVQPVHFGPRVMRTETAGLAAVAALNAVHGDLR